MNVFRGIIFALGLQLVLLLSLLLVVEVAHAAPAEDDPAWCAMTEHVCVEEGARDSWAPLGWGAYRVSRGLPAVDPAVWAAANS